MIARHDPAHLPDKTDLWSALAAPLTEDATRWHQDGAPVARDGGWYVRFVAQPAPNAVRERLDRIVPGEWDLTLELLPSIPGSADAPGTCAFKARLQILGVIREDVGVGRDYKAAAADAFTRAAVRFGIGHELVDREPNWIAADGPGDGARPVEAPTKTDARRRAAKPSVVEALSRADTAPEHEDTEPSLIGQQVGAEDDASCPKCGGRMWNNRLSKRNPKAPDFKCRDRSCDGVIWPDRSAGGASTAAGEPADRAVASTPTPRADRARASAGSPNGRPLGGDADDDLPF